jgi:outer membrane protein assembly factor BamB
MLLKTGITALVGLLVLTACAKKEEILQGERLDLRASVEAEEQAVPALNLPKSSVNTAWTHRNGNAAHYVSHPALSASPKRIWSTDIGVGNKKRQRLASDPIVAGGRIFALDADGTVVAFGLNGAKQWSVPLKLPNSPKSDGSGGGLAYADGQIAVTTGVGEVALLSASTGAIAWRHRVSSSISVAPAFDGNTIVVVTGENRAIGLDAKNGREKWAQKSSTVGATILGTGTPAIASGVAIVPFGSGEVLGVVLSNGLQAWNQVINGHRIGSARGLLKAVSGGPVVVGDTIYAGTNSGRLTAMDRRSGQRIWTTAEGAIGPVWPAGNSLFVLTDQQKLKRLDRDSGAEVWSTDLPLYRKAKKQKGKFGHFGPVLAGGRLYVAGSDGEIRAFDPATGALVNSIAISGGAASQVVVAGGRMYVLSNSGQLIAFQ